MALIPTAQEQSTFDLPMEAARERISALHASARPVHRPPRRGIVTATREALGTRLIAIGTALRAEEGLRRPATHP